MDRSMYKERQERTQYPQAQRLPSNDPSLGHHSNYSVAPLQPLPMYDLEPTPSELEELNKPFIPRDWYKQKKYISRSCPVLSHKELRVIIFSWRHSGGNRPRPRHPLCHFPRRHRESPPSLRSMDEVHPWRVGNPHCHPRRYFLPSFARTRTRRTPLR